MRKAKDLITILDNIGMLEHDLDGIDGLVRILYTSLLNMETISNGKVGIIDNHGSVYDVKEGLNELALTISKRINLTKNSLKDIAKDLDILNK